MKLKQTTKKPRKNKQTDGKKGKTAKKNQKKNQKKKGKTAAKPKQTKKSPTKSPSRKRQILADENGKKKTKRGGQEKEKEASPKSTAKKPAAKATAKSKAKAAPKSKAHSKKNGEAKKVASKKSKAPALVDSPLSRTAIVQVLVDYAKAFPEELETDMDKMKDALRKRWVPLTWTKLMPYWTKGMCGVKVWDDDAGDFKSQHTFSYTTSSTPLRYRLAIASRCAELAAP